MRTKILLLTLLAAFAWSCEKDDLDIITETEEPREPEVVEVGEPFFAIKAPNLPVDTTNGKAIISADRSTILVSTSENAELRCSDDTNGLGGSSNGGGYSLWLRIIDAEAFLLHGVAAAVPGLPATDLLAGTIGGCSETPPQVDLTVLNDTFIAGTITAEFFGVTRTDSTSTDVCDFVSVGIHSIEFAAVIENCQ